uniref:Uncharacterized protein n=1 Tax=Melicertus latisulcatus majanivirus TaxID=2984277 RepID=A0A9C7EYG6_9VIRU|nr:MAG: hypothetical protein [Melicertus latisulcatus majanivirus]
MSGHGLRRTSGDEELGDQQDTYGNHKKNATNSIKVNNSKIFPILSTNEVQQSSVRPLIYPTHYVHPDDPRYSYYKSEAYDKRRDNSLYRKQDNLSQYYEHQRFDNKDQYVHSKKPKSYQMRHHHPYYNNNRMRQQHHPSQSYQPYYKNSGHQYSHRYPPQNYQHEQEPYEVAINRYKKDMEYRQHEQEQQYHSQQYMSDQKCFSCSLKNDVNRKPSELMSIKDTIRRLLINTSLFTILETVVEQYSEIEEMRKIHGANKSSINNNEKNNTNDDAVDRIEQNAIIMDKSKTDDNNDKQIQADDNNEEDIIQLFNKLDNTYSSGLFSYTGYDDKETETPSGDTALSLVTKHDNSQSFLVGKEKISSTDDTMSLMVSNGGSSEKKELIDDTSINDDQSLKTDNNIKKKSSEMIKVNSNDIKVNEEINNDDLDREWRSLEDRYEREEEIISFVEEGKVVGVPDSNKNYDQSETFHRKKNKSSKDKSDYEKIKQQKFKRKRSWKEGDQNGSRKPKLIRRFTQEVEIDDHTEQTSDNSIMLKQVQDDDDNDHHHSHNYYHNTKKQDTIGDEHELQDGVEDGKDKSEKFLDSIFKKDKKTEGSLTHLKEYDKSMQNKSRRGSGSSSSNTSDSYSSDSNSYSSSSESDNSDDSDSSNSSSSSSSSNSSSSTGSNSGSDSDNNSNSNSSSKINNTDNKKCIRRKKKKKKKKEEEEEGEIKTY